MSSDTPGRRAVACRGWRWVPGMRVLSPGMPPGRVADDGVHVWVEGRRCRICSGDVPDLTDPATLGCLVALVRAAWGRDDICARRFGRGPRARWHVDCTGTPEGLFLVSEPSEAVALVVALELAP